MGTIKSSLSFASESESGLKSKCIGLGTGKIEEAQESNINGVKNNASVYKECANALRSYKELLDADATRIHDLGVMFFEFDHSMAGKM